MKRRPQFSLRFMIFGVTFCALLLTLWLNRPPRALRVELTPQETAVVDYEEIELSSLGAVIDREGFVRRLWLMEPLMTIRVDASVPYQNVVETITLGQHAGFKKFTFATVEHSSAQQGVAAEQVTVSNSKSLD